VTGRVTLVAVVGALVVLFVVLELVRRRKLQERYSMLWIATALVLFVLAIWGSALQKISDIVGVAYPPTTLFIAAATFFLLMLLHYSTVLSRLTDQNMRLAQRLALMEERVLTVEREGGNTDAIHRDVA
jgi:hypothetical protein